MSSKKYIKYLESKIEELTRENSALINKFLRPKKKPFDAPQYSIKLKLPGEIPSPLYRVTGNNRLNV